MTTARAFDGPSSLQLQLARHGCLRLTVQGEAYQSRKPATVRAEAVAYVTPVQGKAAVTFIGGSTLYVYESHEVVERLLCEANAAHGDMQAALDAITGALHAARRQAGTGADRYDASERRLFAGTEFEIP